MSRASAYLLALFLSGVMLGLAGCSEELIDANQALGDTKERVEQNLLPPLRDESGDVLRNLMNLLPLFTEVCATPVGELGDFVSSLPELQRAQQLVGDRFHIDEQNGSWRASWRDVVFGVQDGQLPPGVAPIDLTLTVRLRSQTFTTIQALPFLMAGQTAVNTARNPAVAPTCNASTPEGFNLFQDATTGLWTLSWCATGETKTFSGSVVAESLSRVVRRLADDAPREVSSLERRSSGNEFTFSETGVPGEVNGFRFFARPGDLVRLQLRISIPGDSPTPITRDQLVIGTGQVLPANLEPGDFRLASSLPVVPTGSPAFTAGTDLGTFIWRDDANNQCLEAGAEQWRLRLSTPGSTLFTGTVRTANEDETTLIRVTPVGVCPSPSIEEDTTLVRYECRVMDATPSGYDFCLVNSQRAIFAPEVEDVLDPSLVWIGSMGARPPAADPFTILFELDAQEQGSAQDLRFEQAQLILQGDVDEDVVLDTALRSEQVSLDPLCKAPVGPTDIQVRLTGQGEYLSERFEGSLYVLDDVEFTDGGVTTLERARYPDAGRVILRTREQEEAVEVTVPMVDIQEAGMGIISLINIDLRIDTLQFLFDGEVNLTFE